ncbi:MAG TPA: hypothetical protein VLB12_00985, partial [Gemmatimonadales bacterium]|nr:hypothetical protein [Gemmatimonadales bacterium]
MIRRTRMTLALAILACALGIPSAAKADFGIEPGSVSIGAENRDGTPDTLASSHPFSFELHFALKTDGSGITDGGAMRDVLIDLPPGL